MMNDLPAPLVDADVDLRDFAFMPLDVLRLRDSGLTAKATGDEFRAAVLLWCASWHQVPAGSLPDDDAELANLCGYSRAVKEWKKVRDGALRGFVLCNDGRLYHPTVAEKARDSWEKKCAQRARTEAARKAREETRQKQSQSLLQRNAPSVTGTATESKGQGQGQGQGQGILKPNPLSSTPTGSQTPHPKDAGAKDAARATRLAAEWTLPSEWAEDARREHPSISPPQLQRIADTFADYWHSKGGADARRTDWRATWRNWVRREKIETPRAGSPARLSNAGQSTALALQDFVAKGAPHA
jgi:uncharacterized protein YdaU (DUF1376 family)